MCERNVHAGRKDQVVLLGVQGRIRYIDVAKLILPAQPFADLGHGSQVEGETVLARILQIGVEIHILRDHRALTHLMRQFLAPGESHEFIGNPNDVNTGGTLPTTSGPLE